MGKYKNLAVNTALFAVNSVATRLISFVLIPFYTAHMTAGEYGITDMSLAVINLIGPIATLSIAGAAMRFIVADRARSDEYVAVSVVVAALSVVMVLLLSPLLDLGVFGGLGEYKGLFVLTYSLSVLVDLCGNVTRGLGNISLIPVCAVASSLTALVCAFVSIGGLGLGVTGYFISASAGPLVAVVLYFGIGGLGRSLTGGLKKLRSQRAIRPYLRELCGPMLRYALPLIPNSLFWWAQTSISRLFITGMLGISASGMFAAAGKIPGLINTAYSIFQQAWQLSAFQESDKDDLSRFFANVFCLLQAALVILGAALSLVSPLLASVLLQGETIGAWTMIPVLLVSNLMNVFNTFYGTVYTSTMHTSYVMRTTVVGSVACVIFTPLLISVLGLFGACLSSLASQTLVFVLRAVDSRRYIAFEVGWRYLLPSLAILVAQSVVTTMQVDGWQTLSLVCLAMVVIIQGVRVLPMARDFLPAVRRLFLARRNR